MKLGEIGRDSKNKSHFSIPKNKIMMAVSKKVLVSWDIPQIGIDMLEGAGLSATVWKGEQPLSQSELIAMAQEHDALLSQSTDKLDEAFFEACGHLEVISQFSVGYDNINLAKAKACGIPFGNAPGAMTEATADIAFGLMIATSRKFFYMHKKIVAGEWKIQKPQAHLGLDLRGKTLGIFGLGKIGSEMARLCKAAYGMEIIYTNRSEAPSVYEKDLQAQKVSFDTLLEQSDVVSVHAGLNTETRGIFDAKAFAQMKSTAIFINAARGGIHNETDLIHALENGVIWGAGLDVTNPEPMQADNKLLSMETVCVLPHIGSATIGARNNMARMSAENIVSFYENGVLPYLVE
ncbi:MAG: D-glycerate dehydrogenase [Saprospiraceae bacterium]